MTEQQERALSHDGAAMSRSSTEGGEREHVKSVEDEEGTPDRALYDAIIEDDLEAVKRALAIGGNPNRDDFGDPISHLAQSRAVIEALYANGASIHKAKMSNPARSLLVGLSDLAFDDESHPSPLERITKEQFDDGRARRFGATNPEKMNVPFWNAMVESSSQAWDARVKFLKDKTQVDDNENGSVGSETEEVGDTADRSVELDHDQNGKSEDKEEQAKMTDKGTEPQGSDPDQGQDQNQHQEAEASVSSYWGNPIWCIDRFGHSLTTLPDGTHVQIGGEHEDWYDPDFLIYNDVIVHHATSTPENPQYDIYGYPEDVFRPTDFHSATFVPALEAIFIIGCNGYETPDTKGVQERGETPIYKLSMGSWKMEKVDTKGKGPGWIWRHDARLVGNTIRIKDNENGQAGDYSRAKKYVMENGERKMVNFDEGEDWLLDIDTLTWRKSD